MWLAVWKGLSEGRNGWTKAGQRRDQAEAPADPKRPHAPVRPRWANGPAKTNDRRPVQHQKRPEKGGESAHQSDMSQPGKKSERGRGWRGLGRVHTREAEEENEGGMEGRGSKRASLPCE